jgi:hypothetical protein
VTAVLVLAVNDRDGSGAPPPTASPAPAARTLPPLPVDPPPALPASGQKACRELVSALPVTLGDRPARPVDSSSPYVAAWGEPPVVLRCGVPRPAALRPDSEVLDISGVTFFAAPRGATTAYTTVDRSVYVEVVAPSGEASGPAARLATAISRALPKR